MSVTTTKPRRLLCRPWEVRAYLSGAKTQFRVPIRPQPTYMDGRWWKFNGGGYSTLDYVSRETATGIETELIPELPELIQKLWKCPFGTVGQRLWLAETWAPFDGDNLETVFVLYRASFEEESQVRAIHQDGAVREITVPHAVAMKHCEMIETMEVAGERWFPSTQMPQWASRLMLEVKSVRVQRLQDISEEDAIAEGCKVCPPKGPNTKPCYVFSGTKMDNAGLCHSSAVTAYAAMLDETSGTGSWESNPFVRAVSVVSA